MRILSGTDIRTALTPVLREKISMLSKPLRLVIFQAGEDAASQVYIGQKKKYGESLGVIVEHVVVAASRVEEMQAELMEKIAACNRDDTVTGIIVQLPLPEGLDRRSILDAIDPAKDVDGLGSVQGARLYQGDSRAVLPATARGIMSLCDFYSISLEGAHVVVIGRSDLVGKPSALSALRRNATVTICHSKTNNLADITRSADIIIVACGIRRFLGVTHVRPGQVVIDVGIHKTEHGLCGDVDFEAVKDIVEAITPVPGGVGPLTVMSLFENVLESGMNHIL